jgi:hypothetical protein
MGSRWEPINYLEFGGLSTPEFLIFFFYTVLYNKFQMNIGSTSPPNL